MEIVEQIQLHHRGGGGGGRNKDTSSNLDDMTYAEKLVMSKEMLEALASLNVAEKVGDSWTGGSILLSKEDIPDYFKDGDEGMNGACHYINKVFVASGFPFYATAHSTENAERKVVTRMRGKNVGQLITAVIADRIRVYRITNDFDVNHYACDNSTKVTLDGINSYQQPTEGMYLRVNKWLEMNKEQFKEILMKLGYS